MIGRCVAAVDAQTVTPAAHLIGIDHARTGHGARIRNTLIAAADTTWIACCDDDDWFLPHHLEHLLAIAGDNDVVVAEYRYSDGRDGRHFCDPDLILTQTWAHPSCLLLRRAAVLAVGGFPDPAPPVWDDWALLIALYQAGAQFVCLHEVTSVKGVHPGCISGPALP